MVNELITKPVGDLTEVPSKAVGGTLAEVWQGIVGDPVSAWRIKRAARLNGPLQAALEEAGVELRAENLPEGMAFRWFQRATEADEPEIQELFAKLLANAASGNKDALVKRNVDLVSNLTPEDAKLLALINEKFSKFMTTRMAGHYAFSIDYDWVFEREYRAVGFETTLPIDALLSLGIIRLERDFKGSSADIGSAISLALSGRVHADINVDHMFEQVEKLVLTEVGKSLLLALFPVAVGASNGD